MGSYEEDGGNSQESKKGTKNLQKINAVFLLLHVYIYIHLLHLFTVLYGYYGGEQTYVLWLRAHWAEDSSASPWWGHKHADVPLPQPGATSVLLRPGQALAQHMGLPAAACDTFGSWGLMPSVTFGGRMDMALWSQWGCGFREMLVERGQRRLRRETALISISVCTEGDTGLKASALPSLRLLIPINY